MCKACSAPIATRNRAHLMAVSIALASASETRCRKRHVGVLPGVAEALLDLCRLLGLAQAAQALQETKKRPAVLRMPPEVLAVDRLRLRQPALLYQDRTQRLPDWEVPVRRLHVRQLVLQPDRLLQSAELRLLLAAQPRELCLQDGVGKTHQRCSG